MMRTRKLHGILLLVMIGAAGCKDTAAPPKPHEIALVSSSPGSVEAGSVISTISVAVKDDRGNAMSGQPITISVAGGGTITGSPSTTSGSTPIGSWTLAPKVGANTVTVSSGTLTPLVVTVQGIAGPAAKFNSTTPTAGVSVVGTTYPFVLTLVDRFDNPVTGAVSFAITGGGTLSTSTGSADATGNVVTPTWTLGTLRGPNTLTATAGAALITFAVSAQAGPASTIQVTGGSNQTAFAGTALPSAVTTVISDRYGNPVARQAVSYSAIGGGTPSASAATADTNGIAVLQSWTLGKRNVPQQLQITAGSVSQTVNASVRTSVKITLRFFGSGMTDAQKTVFQGAADRISAMVTTGGSPVQAANFDLATACGLTGMAPITEVIDGIVIYASISPIDGPGKTLAQSGPCGFRGSASRYLPALAIIEFDVADIALLTGGGSLEDVATHEMMHSLGYGTLWTVNSLVSGSGGIDPRYLGFSGIQGCRGIGATTTCLSTVPLENTGGQGTANSHWRETTFSNELMTGYLNNGSNPFSTMSISSMIDLGYSVNVAAGDSYVLTTGLKANSVSISNSPDWEKLFTVPETPNMLRPAGGGIYAGAITR